jgi:diguanylate cyclase (GGDEF)-like protein
MRKFFQFRSIQTHIIFSFGVLLFVIQLLLMLILNIILSNNAKVEIEKSLNLSTQLIDYIADEHSKTLAQHAKILVADFAFRQAIATEDQKTIVSTLDNYRGRLKADLMFLADNQQKIIASSNYGGNENQSLLFPDLLHLAEQQGVATSIVLINNQLYDIVIVPVLGPMPIAWLASAFIINDESTRNIQKLIDLDLSFLLREQSAHSKGKLKLLASSFPMEEHRFLVDSLSNVNLDQLKKSVELELNNETYLAHLKIINIDKELTVLVVIQQSLNKALKPLYFLQQLVFGLGLLAFIIALLISKRIAKNITLPIQTLSDIAQRLRQGDYSTKISLNRVDEIGGLAFAFQEMANNIKDREAKIMMMANFDALTGLPNRIFFNDRLSQSIKIAYRLDKSLVVMIIDVNRFKKINEIMGHDLGNTLLFELATRLKTVINQDIDILARMGEGEFAVLLETDLKQAKKIAVQLLKVIDSPIELDNKSVLITASIGMSCYPDHALDMSSLVQKASLAMYQAKHNHKSCLVFDPTFEFLDQDHLSLMVEIRRAVIENEFVMYYQPKLEIATGIISHAEALIRWIHPIKGLVPPSEFIPFAEENDFIESITLWAIDRVLVQQKQLIDVGIELVLSINISSHDLLIPDFSTIIADLLSRYQVPAQLIILEVTESAIMTNLDEALVVLNEIYKIGVQLSVDDFGTGYSSLAYLKRLPLSELKIDQSFVFNMQNNHFDYLIVSSTLELAHNMNLKVVAEGVENSATSELLKSLGCDFLQGYYICRPLPIELMLEWAKESIWSLNIKRDVNEY